MPIPYFKLHDRTAEQLASELVSLIPGHTPEWRNPRPGDPGRTLIDLFAWLGDKLLYRVNLLPERQRLMFLRLLNMPLKPARAARGLLVLEQSNPKDTKPIVVPARTAVQGPAEFETTDEITVLPVEGACFIKRQPDADEVASVDAILPGLTTVYGLEGATPYVTTPLFAGRRADPQGVDLATDAVDQSLWIALLARDADAAVLGALPDSFSRAGRGPLLLNVGFEPRTLVEEEPLDLDSTASGTDNWVWQIPSAPATAGAPPDYITLQPPPFDSTEGFRRRGVLRLVLPDAGEIWLPPNDPDQDINAGVGDRPPRIDDPETAARLFTWIRLKPKTAMGSFPLSWMGVNAVQIEQYRTLRNVVAGASSGAADQRIQLAATSVDPASLVVEVQRTDGRYETWTRVDDLYLHGRDDKVYQLDAEAGVLGFGDGMRGAVPPSNARIRLVQARHGGGMAGNLPAGVITTLSQPRIAAYQPVATQGGEDAETLDAAEKRIPSQLRHNDRAVIAQDYADLAAATPGITLGRVEVMPRFRPFQRRSDVPGVVSVMIIPQPQTLKSPHPRADRPMIQAVFDQLDPRRTIGTEMHVIGVEFVPVSVSASVGLREGFAADKVLPNVETALRRFLFPVAPGGREGTGWPLGQSVSNLELEVIAARVPGVQVVFSVNLFTRSEAGEWVLVVPKSSKPAAAVEFERWQLPELAEVTLVTDQPEAPAEIFDPAAGTGSGGGQFEPVPVVPEVC